MQTTLTVISIVVYAYIIALHVLSAVFSDVRRKIAIIANITLHITLVFLLLFRRCSLELVALCFVFSLFTYTLCSFIGASVRRRRGAPDKEVEL